MTEDYLIHHLPNGIRLLFLPTGKFKTISIGMLIHQDLKPETAALNALLPSVLEQGCRLYPDYLTLQRKLENLYGAELSTDIIKSGERHILSFGMEGAHDRFIGEQGRMLPGLISILGALLTDPLLDAGQFRESYVNQEKSQLIKDIKALLNDKAAYATERCLSTMCAEESFGVFKLGRISDYASITGASLYEHYRRLLREAPVDLYVIGDLDKQAVLEAAEQAFTFSEQRQPEGLAEIEIDHPVSQVRTVEDEMTVNQAKLVLGYRTFTAFSDDLHCPLLVYSGVLGSFPHSKLFMKVREEAGLAYYINTRLERHKGLMLISAGINAADHSKAREIIDQQTADMVTGNISDSELENTKRGLVNQMLSRQDSPSQLIAHHLDGVIGSRIYSFDELIRGIEKVDRQQISAVAERIKLDTAYLLKPREGEVKHNDR